MNATTVGRTLRAAGVAAALLVPIRAQVETWNWHLEGGAVLTPGLLQLIAGPGGPAYSKAEVVAPDQGVLSFDLDYAFSASAIGGDSYIMGPAYDIHLTPGIGICQTLPCSGTILQQSVVLHEGDDFQVALNLEWAVSAKNSSIVLRNMVFTPDVGFVELKDALGGGVVGIVKPLAHQQFAADVQALEDVDHDGHADILVSSYDGGARVDLVSGATLEHVWTFVNPQPFFPQANWMDGMGDVDGDGSGDVLLALVDVDPTSSISGAMQVRSGVDGALLLNMPAPVPLAGFGSGTAAALGDVNGDGVPDFAAGMPYSSMMAPQGGAALVCSGVDASVLFTYAGKLPDGQLGRLMAGAGDVDVDGVPDLLLGQPEVNQVLVVSGAGGQVLHEWFGQPGQDFGTYIAAAGDANGDGHADLALAAPTGGGLGGYQQVRSGSDGSLLYQDVEHGAGPMAGVGDLDDDGMDDLLVSAFGPAHDGILVLGGPDGHAVLDVESDKLAFGTSVSGGFDVDGDSVGDLLVGVFEDSVVVLSGSLPAYVTPLLAGTGSLQPGTPVEVAVSEGLPLGVATLVIGLSESSLPFKGGVLVPFPDLLLDLVLDAAGTATLNGTWPAGVPSGFEAWMQLWALDAKGPHGWTASNALQLITP